MAEILISAYACAPGAGSEAETAWHWVRWTAEAGHSVTVLTQPEFCEPLREAAGDSVRVVPVDPAPWARLSRGHPRVYADYVGWQNASLDVARSLVAERPTDLVHHVSWGSLIWGTPLWQLPVPLVFGPVGGGQVAPVEFRSYFGDAWAKEALRSWLVTHVLPRNRRTRATVSAARLVVVTNASTEEVVRRMGARLVMQMLDTGLAKQDEAEPVAPPARSAGNLHLLWIGRLLPIKALPLALEAVALAARHADVRLTVVGGGPQESSVDGWIERLGLGDRVTCLGQVPYDRIRPLLREHDALLFTSLRESFGAQVLEAAAQARPTISLDLHGVSSNLADDAAFKVPVTTRTRTVQALADCIVDVAHDPKRRMAVGAAARRFALGQRWEERVGGLHSAAGIEAPTIDL